MVAPTVHLIWRRTDILFSGAYCLSSLSRAANLLESYYFSQGCRGVKGTGCGRHLNRGISVCTILLCKSNHFTLYILTALNRAVRGHEQAILYKFENSQNQDPAASNAIAKDMVSHINSSVIIIAEALQHQKCPARPAHRPPSPLALAQVPCWVLAIC